MEIKYVKDETAKLTFPGTNGKESSIQLLWGDRVEVQPGTGKKAHGKARGQTGYINNSALGDEPLLEVYFIDVAQGDGILIRTPDDRHLLLDGGLKRKNQATRRSAADFVDWKFVKDYGRSEIHLEAMIASHCDADHFGGLWDLVNPDETEELDAKTLRIDNFYHAGVSWWKKGAKGKTLGKVRNHCLIDLLGDAGSVKSALGSSGAGPKLGGEWRDFIDNVIRLTPTPTIQRVSDATGYLPGFAPAAGTKPSVGIKVLAPIDVRDNGFAGLPAFGSDSLTTNGNSVVLRIDYGKARILLTGDLNASSQKVLLEKYQNTRELACDVAKACHHGSDDCSFEFLQAVNAAATVISSGDNESYAHPRPSIVAASALSGYLSKVNDRIMTPLVYSTEIARSVRFAMPKKITEEKYKTRYGNIDITLTTRDNPDIYYKAGAEKMKTRPMKDLNVVAGIVYGLVNVRTDGKKILCATLNEKKYQWDVKTFDARF